MDYLEGKNSHLITEEIWDTTEKYIFWEWIAGLRKSHFSIVWISSNISFIIWEEHGIHCMPCSSQIISEMTP